MFCSGVRRLLAGWLLWGRSVLGADSPKTASLPQSQLTPLDPVRIGFVGIERIENLYLLHCVSQYPTEDSNVNLRVLPTMKDEFPEYKVGYSVHSRGIEACLAAVALGAEVIEKHFTFHTRLPGDDDTRNAESVGAADPAAGSHARLVSKRPHARRAGSALGIASEVARSGL